MSTMAKVFVVVNLVLVTAVWGSAATLLGAQDDYRKALKEAQEAAAAVDSKRLDEIQSLTIRVSEQTALASKHLAAATDAEQRWNLAKADLDAALQINQQISAANQGFSSELQVLRKQIETQQATVSAAQSEAKDANDKFNDAHKRLEEESANRAALEARVQELDDSTRTLQAKVQEQADELRQKEFWLQKAEEQGFQRGDGGKLPEGRILQVENVAGGGIICIISVGSDDGVRVGAEYRFSRGTNFVGFGRVTRVYKDKAVVEFDTANTGSGAPPQAQDRAYAR